jgi:(E)-4-hydroxy-3-methylbut-2-enyl-diphosphate synthase
MEALQAAAELGVSRMWLDVQNQEDISRIEEISHTLPLGVVAVINDSSLIDDVLRMGVSGIAVQPFCVEELLRHRDELIEQGSSVYLCMRGVGGRSFETFFSLLNEVALRYEELKKAGIQNLFVHISHPDPVILFNALKMMKERFGTHHLISLKQSRGREKNLLRNSLILGSLFYEGIGEALLLHPSSGESYSEKEVGDAVTLAKKVLGSCKLFPRGYTIISCPTCGRCRMDLLKMTVAIDRKLKALEERYNRQGKQLEDIGGIAVAVMGCNVNGPGEARNADIGIAGKKNKTGILFKNGKPFKTLPESKLVDELIAHTEAIIDCKFESSRC